MKHHHTQQLTNNERAFLEGSIKEIMGKRPLGKREILCLVHNKVGFRGFSKETIRSVLDDLLMFDPLVKYSM